MIRTLTLASILGLGLVASAAAAPYSPAIPNPVNPKPAFPIATDGSPLLPGWSWEDRMSMDRNEAELDWRYPAG